MLPILDPLKLYTAHEVSALLRLPIWSVKQYARAGHPHSRGGRRKILFTAEQIELLRDSLSATAACADDTNGALPGGEPASVADWLSLQGAG